MYEVNKVTQMSLLISNICQQRKGWARDMDVVVLYIQRYSVRGGVVDEDMECLC